MSIRKVETTFERSFAGCRIKGKLSSHQFIRKSNTKPQTKIAVTTKPRSCRRTTMVKLSQIDRGPLEISTYARATLLS